MVSLAERVSESSRGCRPATRTTTSEALERLYLPIYNEIQGVRSQVKALWTETLRLVDAPALMPPTTDGKMLRPALCLLASGALGVPDVASYVPLATAVEVLHLAALAHDDVVDGATLRRGRLSLNALWDDRVAVLGGDYLVSRALAAMGAYDSGVVVAAAVDVIRAMTEAELRVFGRQNGRFRQADYLRVAEDKTGSLFALACTAPAILTRSGHLGALRAYGMAFGTAFQLIDDLLDLTQTDDQIGKTACSDLMEGKNTLPILLMKQGMGADDVARLNGMRGRRLEAQDRAWVLDMLEETGAGIETERVARRYTEKAVGSLGGIPASAYRSAMEHIASFGLGRLS